MNASRTSLRAVWFRVTGVSLLQQRQHVYRRAHDKTATAQALVRCIALHLVQGGRQHRHRIQSTFPVHSRLSLTYSFRVLLAPVCCMLYRAHAARSLPVAFLLVHRRPTCCLLDHNRHDCRILLMVLCPFNTSHFALTSSRRCLYPHIFTITPRVLPTHLTIAVLCSSPRCPSSSILCDSSLNKPSSQHVEHHFCLTCYKRTYVRSGICTCRLSTRHAPLPTSDSFWTVLAHTRSTYRRICAVSTPVTGSSCDVSLLRLPY